MPKEQILHQIQSCRPRPNSFFVVRNILLAGLISLLSVLAVVSLATFFRDLYLLQITYRIFEVLPAALLTDSFVELLLAGFAFCLLALFLYRTTDWCLAHRTRILFITLFFNVLVISGLLTFTASLSSTLDQNRRNLTTLPYRTRRASQLERQLQTRGYIVGRVERIDPGSNTVTIITRQGSLDLVYTELPLTLQRNEMVRLYTQDTRIIQATPLPQYTETFNSY